MEQDQYLVSHALPAAAPRVQPTTWILTFAAGAVGWFVLAWISANVRLPAWLSPELLTTALLLPVAVVAAIPEERSWLARWLVFVWGIVAAIAASRYLFNDTRGLALLISAAFLTAVGASLLAFATISHAHRWAARR